MRKTRKRWLALVVTLTAVLTMLASTGVAQAGWCWCNDPIVSIGNEGLGYTTVNIQFASLDTPWVYATSVTIEVPRGVTVNVVDPQGALVTWKNNAQLRINSRGIQTKITVLATAPPGGGPTSGPGKSPKGTRILVQVWTGTEILAKAFGWVGKATVVRASIPTALSPVARTSPVR
ncbi:MAG: hypothetical protein AB1603_07405 [Chloroflexota bacterium]